MKQVDVRQAVLADLSDLAQLLDAYRRFYGRSSDGEAAGRFLRARFEHGESVLFIATVDGVAVGFCQLYPGFSSLSLARTFILNDLYVVEGARKQGVASRLLEAAAEYARQVGALCLTLSTATGNQTAQALYERLGWIRDLEFHVYNLILSAERLPLASAEQGG
ncbi:GNAT family N-acetyltransferase [Synechococcus sp. CCY 9618]|uniref:GNAT family N-acetyltransferase n=1 Tax=Synechococcus sp. CCY 9618 TaxID=2815602 RepID=UPI001C2131C3|nr:GNAT family N-acetyltransferase [Synechococcus sp. CCY 9618]